MNPTEDLLTGLRNRHSFMPLLRQHVGLANDRKSSLGLVVVDINGFSRLNATHGFDIGDGILKELALRLTHVARAQDYVARIGDNRFALILTRVMDKGHVDLAIRKLFRLLDLPFEVAGLRIKVAATVGAALCPMHASQADYLLRLAERALEAACASAQQYMLAPDIGVDVGISEHWDLEVELRDAVERGQMSLYYQPKVRVADRGLVGAEALMRWQHRTRGAVSPELFIPVAEQTGQICSITAWALNMALRHAGQWGGGSLSVAVNVPPEMIARHDLPDLVENSLQLWGSSDTQLVLEITERSLVADHRHSFAVLSRIRDLGVRISIDDFGTGYSCLAYFKDIPADELKIDRSFVRGLLDDAASLDITTLIIDLAHRFGLSVVGEGVEDEATFQVLSRLGCDMVQGYLFSPALSPDAFLRHAADAAALAGSAAPADAGALLPSAILAAGARSSAG
ncbi:MAG: bifunctional diguanylate cyclase/phosphodiesterase [Pseudomonadota bacterium]|nr:bifunctional diguanylate cyclase/phosphodiesterase [Pseudomonadota bacterium]